MSVIVQNGVEIGRPFIAVQINYRLSAWGFMYGDQIAGEGSTNIGLRDQRLGLHWVQENIAAFGGDPKQVTIWGKYLETVCYSTLLTTYQGRAQVRHRLAFNLWPMAAVMIRSLLVVSWRVATVFLTAV